MLGTHARPRPNAEPPPGAETAPVRGPSYAPGFQKRQPIVSKVDDVAPGTIIDYDRGTVIKPTHLQAMPLPNSEFSMLFRGPIRNFHVRDWYWRAWWNGFDDATMPNAHVLPNLTADPNSQPGAAVMTSRARLTMTLRTPAWTIEPPMNNATSTAPGDN